MRLVLTPEEIANIKACGKILSSAISEIATHIKPGISGYTLDKIAEGAIRRQGAKPSFLNYGDDDNPFPATICFSINDEVVHGIPTKDKVIRDGDLVSIDIGAEYKGVYTDAARSYIAGRGSAEDHRLLRVTSEALEVGIAAATAGAKTGDIGFKIQRYVEANGFSVVKALVGHGIGLAAHQDPQVPNYGRAGEGDTLLENMAIAIEPMVNVGSYDVRSDRDGWTVRTYDGKRSAHFENTVIITKNKPIVVTA